MDNEADEHRLVGSRLREAREVLNLTQGDVGDALGMQRTTVIAIEAGRRKVTGLELRRFARLYRRDVGWLLGEETANSQVADSALYRATAGLTTDDKQQVLRFAEFLAAGGMRGLSKRTEEQTEPPPMDPPRRRARRVD